MTGAKKLYVSQTLWFDIIYAQESAQTAQILYENADEILLEITASYCSAPGKHLRYPVVITRGVEQFNAYFTYYPFNHIVIYDTAEIPDISVFSETLLSVFTHELTHLVTYNLKTTFWNAASLMFGDAMAGHYLTVTSGMAEGATVAFESSHGEGRLNDPYALQMVRQAKIEGQFPSYSDVKGASDAYPGGAFYYFNGAFAEFLQSNYGMQKYAEFWVRCVNLKNLTAGGAFKKTFGIKINKAWKLFCDRYEVPAVENKNPVAGGQAKDFFEPQASDYSIKNNAGSVYSNLRVCETGLVFLDEQCNTVYFVPDSSVGDSSGRTIKKLFYHDNLDYVNVSSDGRYVSIGYYTGAAAQIKHCAAVYDIQTKKWLRVKGTNIVNPCVIGSAGRYFFVWQNYTSQVYSICVKEITDSGIIDLEQNSRSLAFKQGEVPSGFTDLGTGDFAFIKKSGLEFSLCVSDCNFTKLTDYKPFAEGIRLQSVSAAKNKDGQPELYFSWAVKQTLPRLGVVSLKEGTVWLSEQNISGGVYYPVYKQGQVFYAGQFFRQSRLLSLSGEGEGTTSAVEISAPEAGASKTAVALEPAPVQNIITTLPPDQLPAPELPSKPFSRWQYAFKGLLLPFASLQSREFITLGGGHAFDIDKGVTYISSLPWDSGLLQLSGGYGSQTKSGGFGFTYTDGTDTSLFKYQLDANLELDGYGFKQTHGGALIASTIDFAKRSAAGIQLQADVDYGRVSHYGLEGKIDNNDKTQYFKTVQAASAVYSNISRFGPGTYEKSGVSLSLVLIHNYETKTGPEKGQLLDYSDLAFSVTGYIPKLIPILCRDNFTYNLPVTLHADIFNFQKSLLNPVLAHAETILFGYDIQKAVPGVSALFVNSVALSLMYTCDLGFPQLDGTVTSWRFLMLPQYVAEFRKKNYIYTDYASLKLTLGLTPNIGTFANPNARFDLYLSYNFGKKQNLPQKILDFGIQARF